MKKAGKKKSSVKTKKSKKAVGAPSVPIVKLATAHEAKRLYADVLAENARLRIENEILREGCALIREAGTVHSQTVSSGSLNLTIYGVMRSDALMRKEVELRMKDPTRSWWKKQGPMFGLEPADASQG